MQSAKVKMKDERSRFEALLATVVSQSCEAGLRVGAFPRWSLGTRFFVLDFDFCILHFSFCIRFSSTPPHQMFAQKTNFCDVSMKRGPDAPTQGLREAQTLKLCRKPPSIGYRGTLRSFVFHGPSSREATMFYIGLDIHNKHISICILDKDGKIDQQLKVRQLDQMLNPTSTVMEEIGRFQILSAGFVS